MFNIPDAIYSTVFYWTSFFLCLMYAFGYMTSQDNHLLLKQHNGFPALVITTICTLYVGLRPISWRFQDMLAYYHSYERMATPSLDSINWDGEWGFGVLFYICKSNAWGAPVFFMIVAVLYVLLHTVACKKLVWENTILGFLFCISAFSFWGYATNGIRNGMACSFALIGIIYLIRKEYLWAVIVCIIAVGTHRSTLLPISMAVAAVYFIKSPKIAIYFWLVSIVISLLLGNVIASYFTQLGLDDRMDKYLMMSTQNMYFSRVGFRWDFLLYSSVPVWLTWYVTQKREVDDPIFNQLANTYILSNAFWVMINRAAFSNRFAYLSWFIYPLLIAYVFIRIPLWEEQDKKAGYALLLHAGFTIFMFIIGKLY